ncbi:hypothetical protein ABZ215_14630 [Amycolatopsis sp. NPDC006131]|uniref:TIGR03943 family putative permease subunit n=1 Tax=Amycolatopsis sp. NPDC006131 TaxID=3156731 RepID=UPI0033BA0AF9
MRVKDVVTRAGWDATGSLTGRTVRVTGFVIPRPKTTYLAKVALNCCAADAFPLTIALRGDRLPPLVQDQWVEVTGTVVPGTAIPENNYTRPSSQRA